MSRGAGRLSMNGAVALIIASAAIGATAQTPANQKEFVAAFTCSDSVLLRYALASSEPAATVAEAAFQKCWDLWRVVAEADARPFDEIAAVKAFHAKCKAQLTADCAGTPPTAVYMMTEYQREFIAHSLPKILDARAEAAGK